jgi:hypothetical protein
MNNGSQRFRSQAWEVQVEIAAARRRLAIAQEHVSIANSARWAPKWANGAKTIVLVTKKRVADLEQEVAMMSSRA